MTLSLLSLLPILVCSLVVLHSSLFHMPPCVFRFPFLSFLQVIAIRDIIRPPKKEAFNDVYIVYELMDTDLHQIIRSDQKLNDDHCQVSHQEQCFGLIPCDSLSEKLDSLSMCLLVVLIRFSDHKFESCNSNFLLIKGTIMIPKTWGFYPGYCLTLL